MKKITQQCIEWIDNFFKSSKGETAVIGISGGKDSSVCAALCKEALGKQNVVGVMMPNGTQSDIDDSKRVCKFLDIKTFDFNISPVYDQFINLFTSNNINYSNQSIINLPPRIRMSLLYFVSQSLQNARVCNTTNICESFIGYGTLWGDTVGDFSPIGSLLVSQVREIGIDLGLPQDLVNKKPADGLTGKTDEQVLGFTYDDVEKVITGNFDEQFQNSETMKKIMQKRDANRFKTLNIRLPKFKKIFCNL